MDKRVIYLGKDEAIKANAMIGFTADQMLTLQNALEESGHDYLAHKVEYAREWTA